MLIRSRDIHIPSCHIYPGHPGPCIYDITPAIKSWYQ